MDEQKVRQAIAMLDNEVPRDGARVKSSQYGGGPDEGCIVANKAGYLRLGIEFLKGALPASDGNQDSDEVATDLGYLITDDSTISFDWFRRTESIELDAEPSHVSFVGVVIFAILVALLAFALIGVGTAINWLL